MHRAARPEGDRAMPPPRPVRKTASDPHSTRPSEPVKVPAPERRGSERTAAARPSERTAAARGSERTTAARPSERSARTQPQGRRIPWHLVIAGAAVVVAVTALLAWKPVMISLKLSALDACRAAEGATAPDAAQLQRAEQLAGEFVELVKADRGEVMGAISADRGPWQAQVRIAELARSVDALALMADRRTDPAIRTAALAAIGRIYDAEGDRRASLPRALPEWAVDQTAPRALRESAIRILTLRQDAHAEDVPEILSAIARAPGEASDMVQFALSGLATVLERGDRGAGYVIGLVDAKSPIAEAAAANPALRQVLVGRATIGLMPKLLPLLGHPLESVRALALEAMGGPQVGITDGPQAAKDRERYGREIAPKLTEGTPEAELVGALKAVHRLRLTGAQAACMALLPRLCAQPPAGIDMEFLGQLHGESLVDLKTPDGRTRANVQVKDLTAALASPQTRIAAAKALGRITGEGAKDLPAMRAAIDTLAVHADQPDPRNALHAIVGTAFNRREVAQQLGGDPARWTAWLKAQDGTRTRLAEVEGWFAQQDMTVLQVKAGQTKLRAAQEFLRAAQTDLDRMVEDTAFIPPLGWSKSGVGELQNQVRTTLVGVRKAMSSTAH